MAEVTLHLLGGFRLARDGAETAPLGAKGRALLAYLALNADRGHAREALATLLWGDRGDEQARHSLRQCILSLRKALGDDDASLVVSEGERLRLDAGAVALDVHDFERLAAAGTRESLELATCWKAIVPMASGMTGWSRGRRCDAGTRLAEQARRTAPRLTMACASTQRRAGKADPLGRRARARDDLLRDKLGRRGRQPTRRAIKTLVRRPYDASRSMARAVGISHTSVQNIWRAHGLKPHLVDSFGDAGQVSNDRGRHRPPISPQLRPRGRRSRRKSSRRGRPLPRSALDKAVVFSVDEKSQIQALDRSQPGLLHGR